MHFLIAALGLLTALLCFILSLWIEPGMYLIPADSDRIEVFDLYHLVTWGQGSALALSAFALFSATCGLLNLFPRLAGQQWLKRMPMACGLAMLLVLGWLCVTHVRAVSLTAC